MKSSLFLFIICVLPLAISAFLFPLDKFMLYLAAYLIIFSPVLALLLTESAEEKHRKSKEKDTG